MFGWSCFLATLLLFLCNNFPTLAQVTNPVTPIRNAGSLVVNGTLFLFGGSTAQGGMVTNLYALDLTAGWPISNPTWESRITDGNGFNVPSTGYASMFVSGDGGSFYVYGGINTQSNNFVKYTPAIRQWSVPQYTGTLPPNRRQAPAVLAKSGVAYFWGGTRDSYTGLVGGQYILNETWSFDTMQLVWALVSTPNPPPGRAGHTVTMLSNNTMVVVGGLIGTQYNATYISFVFAPMSDVPSFDTVGGTWRMGTAGGNLPSSRRYHVAGPGPDGVSVVIFGGDFGTNDALALLNDVVVLNCATMQWTRPAITGTAIAPRFGHTATTYDSKMYIMTGDIDGRLTNDLGILDMKTWTWLTTNPSNTTIAPKSNSTTSSSTTAEPTTQSQSSNDSLKPVGGIGGLVGIIIGVVAALAIIVILAVKRPWKKSTNKPDPSINPSQPYSPSMGPPSPLQQPFLSGRDSYPPGFYVPPTHQGPHPPAPYPATQYPPNIYPPEPYPASPYPTGSYPPEPYPANAYAPVTTSAAQPAVALPVEKTAPTIAVDNPPAASTGHKPDTADRIEMVDHTPHYVLKET